MRKLTSHKVNGLNEALDIKVLDEPGQGNACHRYVIYAPWDAVNDELNASLVVQIGFQNGPVQEAGVNGISNESLLAIVEDRLECFQRGPYACVDNEIALNCVRQAMSNLQKRTRERMERGVEGTSQK